MKTEELKNVLSSMFNNIEKENIELYKKIIDSSEIKEFNTPEEFFFAILYPWDNFINSLLQTTLKADKNVEFIFKNSQYIERHFCNLFEKYEGYVCCSDKASTLVKKLLEFYTTGEKIKFNQDAKYTYQLPKKIFKEHDQIIDFYEGLKGLLYGNPQKYLSSLKTIIDTNHEPIVR